MKTNLKIVKAQKTPNIDAVISVLGEFDGLSKGSPKTISIDTVLFSANTNLLGKDDVRADIYLSAMGDIAKSLQSRTAAQFLLLGRVYSEVKQFTKANGEYYSWLEKVGVARSTAENFINVYEKYGGVTRVTPPVSNEIFVELTNFTVLRELSKPEADQEKVIELEQRIVAGEQLSARQVAEELKQVKDRKVVMAKSPEELEIGKMLKAITAAEKLLNKNEDLIAVQEDKKFYTSALRNLANRLIETAEAIEKATK